MSEEIQISTYGDSSLPTLVYLPGLHGDWTLVTSFRMALANQAHFVVVTYPRSLTWSIADYGTAVIKALRERGIVRGWLLGESFGSQVAWEMLARDTVEHPEFSVDAIVLAGGFVKHPWKWGPKLLRRIGRMTPASVYRLELKLYAAYARFRHRRAPEVLETMEEFMRRRTALDRQAMGHRLELLDEYDPRRVAKETRKPIYYLAGLVDPLVPWPLVRIWLRKNCSSYRGGKTIWRADHNVLATSPRLAAETVLGWMKRTAVA